MYSIPSFLPPRFVPIGPFITLLGLLLILITGPATAGTTGAMALTAHKATYRLSLHRASIANDVIAVNGRLEIRLEASCDGWKAEQFLGFNLFGQEDNLLEHVAKISSFESRDGSEFIFSTKSYENRELSEELSGIAHREKFDSQVHAYYSRPKREADKLPPGTIFPGQHLQLILTAARSGRKHLLNTVFDGSTKDNPFEISTFLGNPRIGSKSKFKALRQHTYWPIRLAYYKIGATAPAADFEMAIRLYDHGIAGDMLYDYGDFSVDVRLEQVKLLPMPTCTDK